MINRKHIKTTIIAALALFAGAPLAADTIRLHAGIWKGVYNPELEQRLANDDLFEGNILYRANAGWRNKNSTALAPFGLEYFRPIGPGSLVFGAFYTQQAPPLASDSLGLATSGYTSLIYRQYNQIQTDVEAGYEMPWLGNRLLTSVRVGVRTQIIRFKFDEITVGDLVSWSTDSPFRARGGSLYLRLTAQFRIYKSLYGTAEVIRSRSAGGVMRLDRTIYSTIPRFINEQAKSGYETSFNRVSLGVMYQLTEKFRIHLGMRRETEIASYPNYSGLPIVYGVGSINAASNYVQESISDFIFWGQEQTSTKGQYFVSVSYDLNFGKKRASSKKKTRKKKRRRRRRRRR